MLFLITFSILLITPQITAVLVCPCDPAAATNACDVGHVCADMDSGSTVCGECVEDPCSAYSTNSCTTPNDCTMFGGNNCILKKTVMVGQTSFECKQCDCISPQCNPLNSPPCASPTQTCASSTSYCGQCTDQCATVGTPSDCTIGSPDACDAFSSCQAVLGDDGVTMCGYACVCDGCDMHATPDTCSSTTQCMRPGATPTGKCGECLDPCVNYPSACSKDPDPPVCPNNNQICALYREDLGNNVICDYYKCDADPCDSVTPQCTPGASPDECTAYDRLCQIIDSQIGQSTESKECGQCECTDCYVMNGQYNNQDCGSTSKCVAMTTHKECGNCIDQCASKPSECGIHDPNACDAYSTCQPLLGGDGSTVCGYQCVCNECDTQTSPDPCISPETCLTPASAPALNTCGECVAPTPETTCDSYPSTCSKTSTDPAEVCQNQMMCVLYSEDLGNSVICNYYQCAADPCDSMTPPLSPQCTNAIPDECAAYDDGCQIIDALPIGQSTESKECGQCECSDCYVINGQENNQDCGSTSKCVAMTMHQECGNCIDQCVSKPSECDIHNQNACDAYSTCQPVFGDDGSTVCGYQCVCDGCDTQTSPDPCPSPETCIMPASAPALNTCGECVASAPETTADNCDTVVAANNCVTLGSQCDSENICTQVFGDQNTVCGMQCTNACPVANACPCPTGAECKAKAHSIQNNNYMCPECQDCSHYCAPDQGCTPPGNYAANSGMCISSPPCNICDPCPNSCDPASNACSIGEICDYNALTANNNPNNCFECYDPCASVLPSCDPAVQVDQCPSVTNNADAECVKVAVHSSSTQHTCGQCQTPSPTTAPVEGCECNTANTSLCPVGFNCERKPGSNTATCGQCICAQCNLKTVNPDTDCADGQQCVGGGSCGVCEDIPCYGIETCSNVDIPCVLKDQNGHSFGQGQCNAVVIDQDQCTICEDPCDLRCDDGADCVGICSGPDCTYHGKCAPATPYSVYDCKICERCPGQCDNNNNPCLGSNEQCKLDDNSENGCFTCQKPVGSPTQSPVTARPTNPCETQECDHIDAACYKQMVVANEIKSLIGVCQNSGVANACNVCILCPDQCNTAADCSDANRFECIVNNHANNENMCKSCECQGCMSDNDCQHEKPNSSAYCDFGTHSDHCGECVCKCTSDSDCSDTEQCVDARDAIATADICGECQCKCVKNEDCTGTDECVIATATADTCGVCTPTTQCSSSCVLGDDETCSDGETCKDDPDDDDDLCGVCESCHACDADVDCNTDGIDGTNVCKVVGVDECRECIVSDLYCEIEDTVQDYVASASKRWWYDLDDMCRFCLCEGPQTTKYCVRRIAMYLQVTDDKLKAMFYKVCDINEFVDLKSGTGGECDFGDIRVKPIDDVNKVGCGCGAVYCNSNTLYDTCDADSDCSSGQTCDDSGCPDVNDPDVTAAGVLTQVPKCKVCKGNAVSTNTGGVAMFNVMVVMFVVMAVFSWM